MGEQRVGGEFHYESFCTTCCAVTDHLHGACLKCSPVGFPHRPIQPPERSVGTVVRGPKRGTV